MSEYTESNPRPLVTKFNRDGMTHTQVKRIGNVVMFSVGICGHEVAVIRTAKPQKLPTGDFAPWRESYPSNEEFGRRGWYYLNNDTASAEAKFAALVEDAKRG